MEYENVKIGIFQEKRKTYKFLTFLEYVIFRNIPKMYNQGKIYFSLKYLKWNIPKNCKTKILKFLEYGIFQEYSKNCVKQLKYGKYGIWNILDYFLKMKNRPRGRKV